MMVRNTNHDDNDNDDANDDDDVFLKHVFN